MTKIIFITPILNRDARVIERCALSVTKQTIPDWEHTTSSLIDGTPPFVAASLSS
jgi:hypothetical protein